MPVLCWFKRVLCLFYDQDHCYSCTFMLKTHVNPLWSWSSRTSSLSSGVFLRPSSDLPGMSRMLRTLRRGENHRGLQGVCTLRYPIFPFFIPGEAEASCAQRHTFSHTFGRKEENRGSHPGLSPALSPEACHRPPCAALPPCTHRGA